MKSSVKIPNWEELNKMFGNGFRGIKGKQIKQLKALGYEVEYNSVHPKMYLIVNDKKYCVVLCSTASDCYAGRQILRVIRAIYERGGYKL